MELKNIYNELIDSVIVDAKKYKVEYIQIYLKGKKFLNLIKEGSNL